MSGVKNKLKKILSVFGLKITKDFKIIPLLRLNVFNTNCLKKVLISYITEPFFKKNDFSHTNLQECHAAAEIFKEQGYNVDVVDHFADITIDYSQYEIVYGMGKVLEKSFHYNNVAIKRIFYATGCSPIYSNERTLVRVRNFYDLHEVNLLSSSRFVADSFYLQTFLSNGVIVLGNDLVLNTYKNYDKQGADRYKNLSAFFYDVYDIDLAEKDFSKARKHFLWFGSSGLLHKGLDLLLDIFSERPDICLHICGAAKNEKEFFDCYKSTLSKSNNIINHGFVDIRSDEFKKLMDQCAFVLSPSVSEGGSPAVLNTIANGGLIPIITRASGLDINNFGVIIEEPEFESVRIAIDKALLLDNDQLLNMAITAKNNIRTEYTYEKYKESLKNLIKNIIN
ncbi:MAG: glycosyltransferase [Patescibacteria group bacterium]|jgi:glycosyltransferase involved in cell wall biosynthesis